MRLRCGILLIVSAVALASAQDVLTIDRAVELALDQNRALRSADYDRTAAHWGTLNAWSNYLPKVELAAGYTRIDQDTELRANAAIDFIRWYSSSLGIPPSALANFKPFAYLNTYSTSLTVVQPVYNGGGEFVAISAANVTGDRTESAYRNTEQEVIASTSIAFYSVIKAEELVALARDAAERTRRYHDMTRRRVEVGQRTKTDLLRWEVQLAADEGHIIQAENSLAVARLMLNEVMGVDLARVFRIQRTLSMDSLAAAALEETPLADSLGGALPSVDRHPSMQVMEANLRLADIQTEKAWVNFKPRVNLAFQYGWEKNNTPAMDGIRPWAFSVLFSWPIFNGFGDYTDLQRSKAEQKKTELQVESFRRGLTIQAANAFLSLTAARKRIETARKGQQEAQEVLQSVARRYDSGGASNVDLIDAQVAYNTARVSFVASLYDFFVARVQYARATGALGS